MVVLTQHNCGEWLITVLENCINLWLQLLIFDDHESKCITTKNSVISFEHDVVEKELALKREIRNICPKQWHCSSSLDRLL